MDDTDSESTLTRMVDEFLASCLASNDLPELVHLIGFERLLLDDVMEGDDAVGAYKFSIILVIRAYSPNSMIAIDEQEVDLLSAEFGCHPLFEFGGVGVAGQQLDLAV